MELFFLFTGLGVVFAGVVGVIILNRVLGEHRVAETVDQLHRESVEVATTRVEPTLYDGVPAPVRRYFERVLSDGQSLVAAVQLRQSGDFRVGADASRAWSPFTATQHVTTRPPGFVWDAHIDMRPVSVRVLDAYVSGEGRLRARMGDVFTIVEPPQGPALNEGELLRYLAEAPLYPTALLPEMGIHWTPIDDRSARATISDRGTTVSLVFHFNDRNEVERVSGWRPFTRTDGTPESRPWTGYWRNYEEHEGMWVPMTGEVAWGQADGEAAYWRGRMERIEYTFCLREASFATSAYRMGPTPPSERATNT